MQKIGKQHPEIKTKLHPRNRNRERYNFAELIAVSPELANFAAPNIYGDESIDFANPESVKILNRALPTVEPFLTGTKKHELEMSWLTP